MTNLEKKLNININISDTYYTKGYIAEGYNKVHNYRITWNGLKNYCTKSEIIKNPTTKAAE